MKNLIFLILLFFGYGYSAVLAQKTKSGDTLIFDSFEGVYTQTFKSENNSSFKNGSFKFESKVLQDSIYNRLNKLSIQGSHKDGYYHGYWTFSKLIYELDIKNVNQGRTHSLDYALNGKEIRVVMRFNNGLATGRWMIDKYLIENSRQRELQNSGFIFCNNGFFNGEFSYKNDDEKVSLNGKLNEDGYLDGQLLIRWRDENNKDIREEREYRDGFLLQLNRFEGDDQTPFLNLEYRDVEMQLQLLQNESQNEIKISDGFYGVHFDNGYKQKDLRNEMQKEGNQWVEHFLSVFTGFLDENSTEVNLPQIRFTKRFVFDYGDDLELLDKLKKQNQLLLNNAEQFINTPSNILYAAQSDSVARSMRVMQQINDKARIIEDVLEKIASGFFESRNRDNFYSSGIAGLNTNETLYYPSKKDSIAFVWEPSKLITSADNLLANLEDYLSFLEMKYKKHEKNTTTKVTNLQQATTLSAIDTTIVHYEAQNEANFGSIDALSKKPFENLGFEQKIYLLAHQKKLAQIRKNYLAKTEFEDKKEIGNQYIDNLKNLASQYERLRQVGIEQKRIDSLFTIYEDNPFDYRMVEIPILSQIKEKGLRLFRHYAEELYAETKPERFEQRLSQIELLLTRLKYFSENYNNADVQAINRAVRRESVPARIERLFDLGNDKDI